MIGQVAQQQPAHGGDQKAGQQHAAQRKTRQQLGHDHEQHDLGQHPEGPELADQAARIAERLQVQGQKGVVRAVAQLHQPDTEVKRQDAGAAQLLDKTALAQRIGAHARLSVGHPPAAQHDAAHDQDQRPGIGIQAEQLEQLAQADHRDDEADAAPQANLAVARRLLLQMGEGDDLELRQHRMPEERVQGHDQGQPGIALADEDAGETQQRADRAKAHDGQALAAVIAQPAPDIGRDAAHQHGNGDQFADARGGKAQVIEVQRQERRRGAEQREIEEIETGQAPVGQCGSHGLTNAGWIEEHSDEAPHGELPANNCACRRWAALRSAQPGLLKAAATPVWSPAHRRSARGGATGDPSARWPSSPRRSAWRECRRRDRDGPW